LDFSKPIANSQYLAEISTPRLDLFCLSPDQLTCLLENPAALEQAIEFPITRDGLTPVVQRAIRMKLQKMEKIRSQDHPWFSYWLIYIRQSRFGAGLIGFKGIPPNPADVEIGYGIDPAFQNLGYTTEAVHGIVSWAFSDPRCTGIFAPVLKTNPASSKVLEKAGFRHVSTNEDILFWRLARQEHSDIQDN
jgi:RimJ/RimL family protein N-acetyltransferase